MTAALYILSGLLIAVNVALAVVYGVAWVIERVGLYRFER